MSILILVNWVHVWACLLRTHETNEYFEYFPQTMTRFYSYSCIHFLTQKMTLWYTTPRSPVTSLTIREMWLLILRKTAPYTLVRKTKKTYYCLKYTKAKRFTLVLTPIKYILVFGRRQINWFGCLVKAWTQFCIILTTKSNCRNKFVFRDLLQ